MDATWRFFSEWQAVVARVAQDSESFCLAPKLAALEVVDSWSDGRAVTLVTRTPLDHDLAAESAKQAFADLFGLELRFQDMTIDVDGETNDAR